MKKPGQKAQNLWPSVGVEGYRRGRSGRPLGVSVWVVGVTVRASVDMRSCGLRWFVGENGEGGYAGLQALQPHHILSPLLPTWNSSCPTAWNPVLSSLLRSRFTSSRLPSGTAVTGLWPQRLLCSPPPPSCSSGHQLLMGALFIGFRGLLATCNLDRACSLQDRACSL